MNSGSFDIDHVLETNSLLSKTHSMRAIAQTYTILAKIVMMLVSALPRQLLAYTPRVRLVKSFSSTPLLSYWILKSSLSPSLAGF